MVIVCSYSIMLQCEMLSCTSAEVVTITFNNWSDDAEYGEPCSVMKSLVPCYNSLSWFEVCEASHHQVLLFHLSATLSN